MARILITGMSGAGKSTLLEELAARGHHTVDTDYDGWTLPDGLWDEARMAELLASHDRVVVQGTVENQGRFRDSFDHVVLLSAPVEVLIERVSQRTNNPYGKTRAQQDLIRAQVVEVEPLLRRSATLELDGRAPTIELADAVEALDGPPASFAYAARATEYIELFGRIEAAAAADRQAVLAWARTVEGPILDVGCGPGQWTNLLAELGLEVEGIDPTPLFVAAARHRYPRARFRLGRAESLGVPDHSLGGILAWYSLIHIDPRDLDEALLEFARSLRPGGGLAVGFFEGNGPTPFDHAVVQAWQWPLDLLAGRLEAVGFSITSAQRRSDPDARPHGFISAVLGVATSEPAGS